MPRPSKLTGDLVARIRERRRQGVTYEDLVREFGLSKGTIGNALKHTPPDPPARKQRRTRKADGAPRATEKHGQVADLDTVSLLQRQVRALEELADKAHEDGNLSSFRTLNGALTKTIGLLERIKPPPPPDHEGSLDVAAAAKACRDKLHTMLANILEQGKLGNDPAG